MSYIGTKAYSKIAGRNVMAFRSITTVRVDVCVWQTLQSPGSCKAPVKENSKTIHFVDAEVLFKITFSISLVAIYG